MPPLPVTFEHDPDDSDCARPVVVGTVAGRLYRFVIDTGAARTTMVADQYTSALAVSGSASSHGAFAQVSDPLVTIPGLRAGPMVTSELLIARADGAPDGAVNLLGMDVLGKHRCHFRFGSAVIDIDEPVAAEPGLELQTDAAGHPYVDVHWPGETAYACWDSGAGVTVVNHEFWLAHRELFERTGTQRGTDASGTRLQTVMVRAAAAVIGGRRFAAHKAAVVDLTAANSSLERPMDLILGYPAWRQADWLFDFPARRWALTTEPG